MASTANSVTLCLRFKESARHTVDGVEFTSTVRDFKSKASQLVNLSDENLMFLHLGRILHDHETLEKYNITSDSTIDVFEKPKNKQPLIEPISDRQVPLLRKGLLAILAQKSRRQILENMFRNKETMANIFSSSPGLKQDPVAYGMAKELEMFVLISTTKLDKLANVVKMHPSFGHVALRLIDLVNEEAAKAGQSEPSQSSVSRDSYEIDRASDDDNDDEEEDMELDDLNPILNQAPAAAVAAAAAAGGPVVITNDFFRQAIMFATGSGNPPVRPQPPAQRATVAIQDQLTQLRNMGIMDEEVARRALEQAGGDINLAIEILFGDGMF